MSKKNKTIVTTAKLFINGVFWDAIEIDLALTVTPLCIKIVPPNTLYEREKPQKMVFLIRSHRTMEWDLVGVEPI